MEDEEFYHFMLDDLERLERVHHHIEPPPTKPFTLKSFATEHTHSPLISGFVSTLSGAVKTKLEAVAAKVAERRRSSVGYDYRDFCAA
ncbi:hypothetical protein B0T16DRAFT_423775 [Cercophora newfieldiana]|uniref:Uncharacterized protein n=1 Tax=Cercophora newfieldiana TaxID=92897 RepID=A0AA40CJG8_9PEZI|nr:hypothetical protein B0T16DRAFT_423775 [Cercophora newfieldiana]